MKYGIYVEKNHVWFTGFGFGFKCFGAKSKAKKFDTKDKAEDCMEKCGIIGTAKEL